MVGCSHHSSFYGGRNPSSQYVARMEVTLADPKLFANGIEGTYLIVRIFNLEGKQVTDILPHELKLDIGGEIQFSEFEIVKDVYQARLRPYLESPSIQLQVNWLGAVFSPIIDLETTLAPLQDKLIPLKSQYGQLHFYNGLDYARQEKMSVLKTESLRITNTGTNKIVDAAKDSKRIFTLEYPEHARQNLAFEVRDEPNNNDSEGMISVFMLFPRTSLPYAEKTKDAIILKLPNGEQVKLDPVTHEIIDGVFEEGPVETGRTRHTRNYADLKYKGKGVVLRVNARGQSPEIAQYETNKIDLDYGLTGSVDVLILDAKSGKRCRRPKSDFWLQKDVSPILFKFSTDEEFDKYIQEKCGFGLFEVPQVEPETQPTNDEE